MNILIIGVGTVGSNLSRELAVLDPDLYDKYKNIDTRQGGVRYDAAFVCVDTPGADCDITEVRTAIMEQGADVFVMKSTVLPGTTERLARETGKVVIFSPEYYGGTQHCNNFSFPFTILGGEKEASMQSRAKSGEHLTGTPPYGYKKDPDNPKKWVIDEEPAKIIREIFKLYLGGKNATQIAEMMAEKGYDAPGEYLAKQKQYFKGKSVTFDTPRALWHPGTVLNILDRLEYCGHTVSYRRRTISYKTHKTTLNDEADWIITKNTQPPIVDEDTWQAVHKMRESGRRRKEHVWDKGPLNGFLYCPDCGSKLYFSHPSRLKTSGTYLCGYYLHYKKCSTHYIRRDELEPVVLAQLRKDCAFAREHEDDFVKMVEKKTRRQGEDAVREGEREYAEAKKRIEEIDQIINQLYEDKVSGGLSAERFSIMLTKYEEEQETLRGKCEKLQVQITAARTTSDNAKQFIRVVRKFTEMQELTPEIVATLIERVEVGQAQVVDGVKKQEIRIVYNFIGNIKE